MANRRVWLGSLVRCLARPSDLAQKFLRVCLLVLSLTLGLSLVACGGSARAAGKSRVRSSNEESASTAPAATETYRGFRIDLSSLPTKERRRYFDSLHDQIDLVDGVRIKPEIQAWFRTITIHIDPAMDHGGRATKGELFLAAADMPPDNPVLLHELIHLYHKEKIPGGKQNPEILRFYERAKKSGDFPADAYMLKNVGEYFAMTGSVVLFGRASRPPSTRENVQKLQPQLYGFIVREFGLQP
jgi:hypothetical protein